MRTSATYQEIPSQEDLLKVFRYNQTIGLLTRNGAAAGHKRSKDGYICVGFRRHQYLAHRLIWVMVHGVIPTGMQIDHSNGVRDDNRLENLRLVDRSGNARNQKMHWNNTSGASGVTWHAKVNKWQAQVKIGNCNHYLGLFKDLDEAKSRAHNFRMENGFSPNHGRAA